MPGLTDDTVVLRNNGEEMTVSSSGTFVFASPVADGASYSVEVLRQPSEAGRSCEIEGAQGVARPAAVDVNVRCLGRYQIGGSVAGLVGSGLKLRLSDGTVLSIDRDGAFSFPSAAREGSAYGVEVTPSPRDPQQACSVWNATGVVAREVAAPRVECTSTNPLGPDYLVAPVAATASASLTADGAAATFDYLQSDTAWQSGAGAPQSITLDMGSPRAITEVGFTVRQSASGATQHDLYAGLQADQLVRIGSVAQTTADGETLRVVLGRSAVNWARFLRIVTTQSRGPVGLGKIRVTAAASNVPKYFGYYGDAFPYLCRSRRRSPRTATSHGSAASSVARRRSSPEFAGIRRATARGVRSAVAIHESVLFDPEYRLRPDFERQWQEFAAAIEPCLRDRDDLPQR